MGRRGRNRGCAHGGCCPLKDEKGEKKCVPTFPDLFRYRADVTCILVIATSFYLHFDVGRCVVTPTLVLSCFAVVMPNKLVLGFTLLTWVRKSPFRISASAPILLSLFSSVPDVYLDSIQIDPDRFLPYPFSINHPVIPFSRT